MCRCLLPPELRLPGMDATCENLIKSLFRLLRLLLRDLQVIISYVLMIEEIVFEFPIISSAVEFLSLRKILWLLKLVHGSQSLL